MRVDISFKNFKNSELLSQIIDKNIQKIERRIKLFKKEVPIHLSLHIEKNPHKEEYFSWANLYLPFKVLCAHEKAKVSSSSVNKVVKNLIKQIDKFKHKLERHLRKKRKIVT